MKRRENPDEISYIGTYAIVLDARDKESLALARKASHDQLITNAGDKRRGPVQWRQVPAIFGIEVLTQLEAESYRTGGDTSFGYSDMKEVLKAYPDGALIIATAPVDDTEYENAQGGRVSG